MIDDKLRTPRRHRWRRLILIGVLTVLFGVGLSFNRPIRTQIKTWQAHRHAAKAFNAIDQQKWQEARAEATAAFQLRPNDAEALRVVARFLSRTRQGEALDFWRKLEAVAPLTPEDRRDEATIALSANDPITAKRAVDDLLDRKDSPTQPEDWLLATNVALAIDAVNDAAGFARHLLDDPSADEHTLVEAAVALTRIIGNPSMDVAWERLNTIASKQTRAGLEAAVVLAQRALTAEKGDDDQSHPGYLSKADLIRILNSHPLATTWHRLFAIDLQISADASRRDSLVNEAVVRFKNDDTPSLVALSNWLNAKGAYDKAIDNIPLDRALQDRDLFIQHLDALAGLKRWEEIRQLLEGERFPLDLTTQHMYLARCYAELGQRAASENNWQRALEFSGRDADRLMKLGDYAQANGASDVAGNAYRRAVDAAPKGRAAWRGLLQAARANKQTTAVHDALVQMLKLWPNDGAIQNDEAYFRLLLLPDNPANPQLRDIEQMARQLVQSEPASLPHRTLLALSLLKQSRAAEALQVYSDIAVTPSVISPSARAVHAAVVNANGLTEEGGRELQDFPQQQLLPEELSVVRTALSVTGASKTP